MPFRYILEDSIVDAKGKNMQVVTRNVSFERAFVAEGQSRYVASGTRGLTDFSMEMVVTAWVGALSHRCVSTLSARALLLAACFVAAAEVQLCAFVRLCVCDHCCRKV